MTHIDERLDLNNAALWKETEHDFTKSEDIKRRSLTFYQDVWRRFRENKTAMFSLVFIVLLTARRYSCHIFGGIPIQTRTWNTLTFPAGLNSMR